MFSLKLSRLQNNLIKYTGVVSKRKINNFNVSQQLPITTSLLNQRLQPTPICFCSIAQFSTEHPTLEPLEFENICEETLDHLTEYFEELVESDPSIKEADISYSGGVLTLSLGDSGIYVINKQSPNKQIWLSSPTSGPKRFDFDTKEQYWVYKHTGQSLHQILQEEMPKIFKVDKIDFSRCCYSKV